jgi:anti-sigma-K factor RskA
MGSDMQQNVVDYLLGELSPSETERFETELASSPALRAEAERLRPLIGRLEDHGDAWEPLEPPPLDIAAIVSAPLEEDRPAADRTDASTPAADAVSPGSGAASSSGAARPRRSLAEILGLAWPRVAVGAFSALLLLAVGVGVGLQLGGDNAVSGGGPVQTVQLEAFGDEAPADASGEVLMTSGGDATGDQMTLDVSGLAESSDREFYELWLLGKDGDLIALGSFRVPPGGSSSIEVPLPVNPERYRYFDVSIQPENGDPQHSGRSVLRGLTTS